MRALGVIPLFEGAEMPFGLSKAALKPSRNRAPQCECFCCLSLQSTLLLTNSAGLTSAWLLRFCCVYFVGCCATAGALDIADWL